MNKKPRICPKCKGEIRNRQKNAIYCIHCAEISKRVAYFRYRKKIKKKVFIPDLDIQKIMESNFDISDLLKISKR